MIAYELLCQAIADWKAGARPSASHTAGTVPESYEDVESYDVNAEEMLAVESAAVEVGDETLVDDDEADMAGEAEYQDEDAAEAEAEDEDAGTDEEAAAEEDPYTDEDDDVVLDDDDDDN